MAINGNGKVGSGIDVFGAALSFCIVYLVEIHGHAKVVWSTGGRWNTGSEITDHGVSCRTICCTGSGTVRR